jgi:hypothetical protein
VPVCLLFGLLPTSPQAAAAPHYWIAHLLCKLGENAHCVGAALAMALTKMPPAASANADSLNES